MKHTPHLDKVLLAIGAVDRPFGHSTPGSGMVRSYRRFERGREELVSGYAGHMRHESARSYADVIINSQEGRLGRYGNHGSLLREAHDAHDSPEKMRSFLTKYKLPVPEMNDRWRELHGMPATGGIEKKAAAADRGSLASVKTRPGSIAEGMQTFARQHAGLEYQWGEGGKPGHWQPKGTAARGVTQGTKNPGRGAARPYDRSSLIPARQQIEENPAYLGGGRLARVGRAVGKAFNAGSATEAIAGGPGTPLERRGRRM